LKKKDHWGNQYKRIFLKKKLKQNIQTEYKIDNDIETVLLLLTILNFVNIYPLEKRKKLIVHALSKDAAIRRTGTTIVRP
jgi:hypothetical protein